MGRIPELAFGLSTVLTLFETFFINISSNAFKITTASYFHPKRTGDSIREESLNFQPSILKSSATYDTMLVVSIISTMLWCGGYVVTVIYLFHLIGTESG